MNESDASQNAIQANAAPGRRKGFFKKLYRGEYSLPRTFWLYGLLYPCIFSLLPLLALLGASAASSMVLYFLSFILLVILVPFLCVYSIALYFGIWRSATKYQGPKIWAILAKIYVVLCILSSLQGIYELVSTM